MLLTILRSTDWLVSVREHVPHFLQWGHDPKSTNPHNSGPEVDIDFVPTAFFIARRVLKCGIVKVIQVAPPEAAAPPTNRKTPISRFLIDNFWPKFADR